MTTTDKDKKYRPKRRSLKEASASFQKKNSSSKKKPVKRVRKKPVSKPASRRRISKDDRVRQIQIRIGLFASVILLFVILWFMRVFPIQKDHAINLSASVTQYKDQVRHYCEEYSIPAFSEVVLAIMQQESAGTVPDVMQASESPFNTWYSNTPNSILDPDYSIRVGVETFAYCLNEAGCTSPRDIDSLKLALQNYNYGNSYATWALDHYGGYSPDNALEFSENMKVRLGWSNYGDPEYVSHVLRYYRKGLSF